MLMPAGARPGKALASMRFSEPLRSEPQMVITLDIFQVLSMGTFEWEGLQGQRPRKSGISACFLSVVPADVIRGERNGPMQPSTASAHRFPPKPAPPSI